MNIMSDRKHVSMFDQPYRQHKAVEHGEGHQVRGERGVGGGGVERESVRMRMFDKAYLSIRAVENWQFKAPGMCLSLSLFLSMPVSVLVSVSLFLCCCSCMCLCLWFMYMCVGRAYAYIGGVYETPTTQGCATKEGRQVCVWVRERERKSMFDQAYRQRTLTSTHTHTHTYIHQDR